MSIAAIGNYSPVVDAAPPVPQRAVVDPAVQDQLAATPADGTLTVIVHLRTKATLPSAQGRSRDQRQRDVVNALRSNASTTQTALRGRLDSRRSRGVVDYQQLWVINAIVVTASPAMITELAGRTDVESITPNTIDIVPTGTPTAPPEPGVAAINAPALWGLGYDGQGVVVASLDSGVDVTHPDLASTWRGGTNSWFDPFGQHPTTPTDPSGHGTATMGLMVGGQNGGTTIGVAPEATWISARIFDDAGNSTASAIHQSLQWVLDPDNNPATADAPAVVNNSWAFGTPGCNLEFQPDLQALRAAGIVPVVAAGNYGSAVSTSVSPANYPEALSVGAITATNTIYPYSSRGPTSCGGPARTYPDVVAPGKNVWTTELNGLYGYESGTSMSAPAVSGALALLLSTGAGTPSAVEAALLATTADLGAAGPDNTFGRGRINVAAAYTALAAPPPTTTTTEPATTTTTTTTTTEPATTTTEPATTTTEPATTTTEPATTTTTTTEPATTTTTTTTTTMPPTTTTVPSSIIFADGFESSTMSAWSAAATNGGRLSVTSQAALSASYGLQANIANRVDMYVTDATPSDASALDVRFQFDPNSVVFPGTAGHDIFRGLSSNGTTVFAVQVRATTGGYQVRTQSRESSGTTKSSTWATITDAPHTIEVAWTAATTPTGKNGTLRLWVDGAVAPGRSGLLNGTLRIEDARLGPQGVPAKVAGTEYFDGYISTLSTYIGP